MAHYALWFHLTFGLTRVRLAHPRTRISATIATQKGDPDPLCPASKEDVRYWVLVSRKRKKVNETNTEVTMSGGMRPLSALKAFRGMASMPQAPRMENPNNVEDMAAYASSSAGTSTPIVPPTPSPRGHIACFVFVLRLLTKLQDSLLRRRRPKQRESPRTRGHWASRSRTSPCRIAAFCFA